MALVKVELEDGVIVKTPKLSEFEIEQREELAAKGVARVHLQEGQRWEQVSRNGEPTRHFELEWHSQESIWNRLVHLRNTETGGVAKIYCDNLEKGERHRKTSGWFWRLAEPSEAVVAPPRGFYND